MEVFLISHTPEPEEVVALAAKTCYSKKDIENIVIDNEEEVTKFINILRQMGHLSPFEHISFTFGIQHVSRVLLAQITRHRLASYSVRSQRYSPVSLDSKTTNRFNFVVPPSIEKSEYYQKYLDFMNNIQEFYDEMGNIPDEDKRYIFPNACETQLVMTMNARELLHFFNVRTCQRSQWEIREMANKILKIVKTIAPNIFENAGPNCVQLGFCPEGKMSCGQANKIKEELKENKKEKKILNITVDEEERDKALKKIREIRNRNVN